MPTAPRSNVEMDLGMLILGGLACAADGCLSSTPAQALVGIRLDEQQKQIAQKTAKITKGLGINRAPTGVWNPTR
jgi:hypothetical protein